MFVCVYTVSQQIKGSTLWVQELNNFNFEAPVFSSFAENSFLTVQEIGESL